MIRCWHVLLILHTITTGKPSYGAQISQKSQVALEYASGRVNVNDSPVGVGKATVELSPARLLRISNNGDRRIAAVYWDISNAMIPDIIVDAASLPQVQERAGAASHIALVDYQWAWDPIRPSSVVSFDPEQLEDAGNLFADSLTSSPGIMKPSSHRAMLLLFSDFPPGASFELDGIAFQADSLAGLESPSRTISAAALVNSEITVLFADGATATCTLGAGTTAAGEEGVAIVLSSATVAQHSPQLEVNGYQDGSSGEYDENQGWHVFVSARAGDRVRISKMVASQESIASNPQQGLSEGSITAEALVTARLRAMYPTFPVNAAQTWQHVEVVIPESGSFDISNLVQSSSVDDFATAFTAVIVDSGGLPVSWTSAPIRLLQSQSAFNSGNLVANGSFESNSLSPKTSALMETSDVEGWVSPGGELLALFGSGNAGMIAFDGTVFLQLGSGIYQDVETQEDQSYELTFHIQTNKHGTNDDGMVLVEWRGQLVGTDGYKTSSQNQWETITIPSLVGSGGLDRLAFVKPASSSSGGLFIDSICLRQVGSKVVNGSFESTVVPEKKYRILSDSFVEGWSAINGLMEVWGTGVKKKKPVDGSILVELDVHTGNGADGIFQRIRTEKHTLYRLSFHIQSRGNNFSSTSESVTLLWRGHEVHGQYHASGANVWTRFVVIVQGSGGIDTFVLQEVSSNSLGPLLDDIALVPLD